LEDFSVRRLVSYNSSPWLRMPDKRGFLPPSARLSSGSSAPVLGKRSRYSDGPKHTHLAWLNEIHRNIWNQQSRRSELFREVNVTKADYTALQDRLKKLHSDRDEPDYDGSKDDVLSEKLNFLRPLSSAKRFSQSSSASEKASSSSEKASSSSEKTSSAEVSSSRHHDPNDDDEEENIEIKSLFPYLLTFLDLSPLAIEETSPGRFTSPLFYRKEYEHISGLIKDKPQNNRGSVIVSGQPGSGEFIVSLSHRI
jgi:hypothetical protein